MFITYGVDAKDTPEKIQTYVENGAEEFFAGFVPKEWLEKYGWEVCPNRRPLGGGYNFTQASELEVAAKEIHRLGKRLNLAVNAHDNGSERIEGIRFTVETMEQFNPDGYIVADPAVMFSMKKWGIERPIHLSTGAGCFSSDSVRFFCEHFNIRRVVIPRKMTLNEMRRMIESLQDLKLEFEVMIMGYRCYFNDEDCHSIHTGARKNLCGECAIAPYVISNRFPANWKDATEEMLTQGNDIMKEGSVLNTFCNNWLKNEPQNPPYQPRFTSIGINPQLAKTMYQNCGLCAIKELRDMGVHALKVPLRGAMAYKLLPLQLVYNVMTHPNPTHEYCRKLLNSPSFCDELTNCYYDVREGNN